MAARVAAICLACPGISSGPVGAPMSLGSADPERFAKLALDNGIAGARLPTVRELAREPCPTTVRCLPVKRALVSISTSSPMADW